jgi:hypothetical protein
MRLWRSQSLYISAKHGRWRRETRT